MLKNSDQETVQSDCFFSESVLGKIVVRFFVYTHYL
jgi:hypothetical protein